MRALLCSSLAISERGFDERVQVDAGPRVRPVELRAELELDYVCDDAPQLIAESLDGVKRVRRIVGDLKNFAHAGQNPARETADLHQCLDSTLNIANNVIKYKAQVVRDYGDLPLVECVPSQINQVFLNLLVNAAQAIAEGAHGTITVHTACTTNAVRVDISDTGSGIAAEHLPQVFAPFFTTKPQGRAPVRRARQRFLPAARAGRRSSRCSP